MVLDCLEKEVRGLEVAIKRQSIPRRYGAGGDEAKAESLRCRLDLIYGAISKIAKFSS